ncbi:uncharacterized protein LOC106759161 [Vigna radiata var. radiata]|uniref:Uncharacterized protein LOC106759161 n=1 Tax=Vigna radiata var. radiata TaxID=3916 RepID=A0A1S3TV86_VIGRR|nr:uncharacterized protein LOC106759161 [Vigna radiata var. radiata]
MKEVLNGKIRFVDDRSLIAEGSGRIVLRDENGREVVIDEVLFVPGLKTNLLSLGQLLQKGFAMKMENNYFSIFDQSKRMVIKASLSQNRTFRVIMKAVRHQCFYAVGKSIEWLWHLRFGHLNFRDLFRMSQRSMVSGLPLVNIPESSDKKLKVLRTVGGGEYISAEFQTYCEKEGIIHELTPPYTPEHNGTTERKNRTIMNMVRCMLKSKELPKFLWGEAVLAATYILNRTPTKRLKDITPKEAWSKIKPNVEHLRVFGSVCFKHVPDQLRRKLDDKGVPRILVGYHPIGGYKLYNPETGEAMVSRDVVVDEERVWDWKTMQRKSITLQLEDETSGVTSEGNLVHYALVAEAEPVTFEQAVADDK